ncbi:MAG TPA: hypothetical protein VFQ61_07540 [Polyangiaceae bacterium]|nr:hypothetical protein [Polyangiaceae bacterium]
MGTLSVENFEIMLLARLSVDSTRPPTPEMLATSLNPLTRRYLSRVELRDAITQTLAVLLEKSEITRAPLQLSSLGRARLARALALDSVPHVRDWKSFRRKYLQRLVARGTSAASGALREPGVAVLARRLGVDAAAPNKISTVVDCWIERELAFRSNRLTLDQLRAALLAKETGVSPRGGLKGVASRAAAKLSGARSGKKEDMVQALAESWLIESSPTPEIHASPTTARSGDSDASRHVVLRQPAVESS